MVGRSPSRPRTRVQPYEYRLEYQGAAVCEKRRVDARNNNDRQLQSMHELQYNNSGTEVYVGTQVHSGTKRGRNRGLSLPTTIPNPQSTSIHNPLDFGTGSAEPETLSLCDNFLRHTA